MDHHIDFYEVQNIFIERIRTEENIELLPTDIDFRVVVRPYQELIYVVYIHVFGREFSVGYVNRRTTSQELVNDFFSRLHDYETDDASINIIFRKIQQLTERYDDLLRSTKEYLLANTAVKEDEITVDISDTSPHDHKRGLPKFQLFVHVSNSQPLMTQDLDIDSFSLDIDKQEYFNMLESKLRQADLLKR